jgi:predicted membrane protein DUF2157
MDERSQALREIAELAQRHSLTAADIAQALGAGTPEAAPDQANRWRSVLVTVLGFLGGTFVFAGIGVFIALQWAEMNSAARVVVTLGSGSAAYLLAILANREPRYEKVFTPMLLIAAVLQPAGMLVAFDEFGSGGDWRVACLITAGVMAAQFAGTFGSLRRSAPLFLAVVFATLFFGTALDLVDADRHVTALVLGASLLLAAIGADRTAHREITPAWYLFGAALFLFGFFDVVEDGPVEILFLAAAAAFVYLSIALHSRTLLFVGTIAILAYTARFTQRHFADSVGWPLALIAFGFFMIGLSAFAFRIDRDYVRQGGGRTV